MDLSSRHRRVVKVETSPLGELYPHNLQMYITPPSLTITLKQFEELAIERLKVLRSIDLVNLKGLCKFSEDWKSALGETMKKLGLWTIHKMITAPVCKQTEADFHLRQRDHISHFLLRLAFCSTEDHRRWYIARELELFRLKFTSLNDDQITEFLRLNEFDYTPITAATKMRIRDNLVESTASIPTALVDKTDFYCVRWSVVPDLVRARRVFVEAGNAYVPRSDMVSILMAPFRTNLAQALTRTFISLPRLGEDERLLPLVRYLNSSYIGDDFKTKTDGNIDIADMDMLSRTSFPLCMRTIHETFRTQHHLKYGARQQYGLFVKGLGVKLEDSLRYWREEFTKKMDLDTFEKKYSYNIRHMYGKEGRRCDYTPFNCMRIIMTSLGPGEQHGCPFKHADATYLKNKMTNYGLSSPAVSEILDLVEKEHYQLACTKYFEHTHQNKTPNQGINHPNFFFEQSQAIRAGTAKVVKKENPSEFVFEQSQAIRAGTAKVVKKENPTQPQSSHKTVSSIMPAKKEPAAPSMEDDLWGEDVDFSSLDF